jgi:hypothetical protein
MTDRLRRALLHLGIGIAIALVFKLTCLGNGLRVFAHELGHAVAAWSMGRFAIPTAIGFTFTADQKTGAAILAWAGIAWAAWHFRERRGLLGVLIAAAIVYPFIAFSRREELFVLAMGHGGEIAFASFAFVRAIGGNVYQEEERPLYAGIAWYLWLYNVDLFRGLVTDPAARHLYTTVAIGGEGFNDFSRIADATGSRLSGVALPMLLLVAVAPPVAAAVSMWRVLREPEPPPG